MVWHKTIIEQIAAPLPSVSRMCRVRLFNVIQIAATPEAWDRGPRSEVQGARAWETTSYTYVCVCVCACVFSTTTQMRRIHTMRDRPQSAWMYGCRSSTSEEMTVTKRLEQKCQRTQRNRFSLFNPLLRSSTNALARRPMGVFAPPYTHRCRRRSGGLVLKKKKTRPTSALQYLEYCTQASIGNVVWNYKYSTTLHL